MIRHLLRVSGWLAVLFAVVALMVRTRAPEAAADERYAILSYPLGEQGLKFAMEGDEEALRVVMWAATDRWRHFLDTRHTRPYAFEARLVSADGRELWSQATWVRARRAVEFRDGVIRTPTWLTGRPSVISEDRLHHLEVADYLDGDATFELRPVHVPDDLSIYAIVFRDGRRDPFQALRARRVGDPDMARRVERMGPWRLGELPKSWRERVSDEVWERLGALPTDARGVTPTRDLYTRFQRIPWEDAPAMASAVAPGGAMAFNTEGEVDLDFEWWLEDGSAPSRVDSYVRTVGSGTDEREIRHASHIGPVRVSDAVSSVQIALHPDTDGPRLLRVRGTGLEIDRSYGDPPRRENRDGSQWLAPDFRNIEAYRVGPGLRPVVFRLEPEERFRVTMRRRMPPAPLPAFWPPPPVRDGSRVLFEALDAEGVVLDRYDVELAPVPSAFERYTEPEHGAAARVAEPEVRYLVPPEGARWLRASGNASVDVNLRVTTDHEPPPILHPSYRLPEDSALSMTYEPLVRDRWHQRGAVQIEALMREERLIRIDAQVRPKGPDDGAEHGDLHPGVAMEKRSLSLPRPFELFAEEDRDGLAAAGARLAVSAVPRPVRVGSEGRLHLDYRVPDGLVGSPIPVEVDGKSYEVILPTAGGRLRIDGLAPGTHDVAVRGGGVFMAPTTGAGGWQVRKVYRLSPGEVLSVPVPPGEQELSVFAYAEGRDDLLLHWEVVPDSSVNAGLFRTLTIRSGMVAATPLRGRQLRTMSMVQPPGLAPLEPLYLTLYGDVTQSGATVRLWVSPGVTAYVRLLATWGVAGVEPERHWPLSRPHVLVVEP